MGRRFAGHQSPSADIDPLLHTRKAHPSASVQRDSASPSPIDLDLSALSRAQQQSTVVALSRVAGNHATRQILQRCGACDRNDENTIQRGLLEDAQGATGAVSGAVMPGPVGAVSGAMLGGTMGAQTGGMGAMGAMGGMGAAMAGTGSMGGYGDYGMGGMGGYGDYGMGGMGGFGSPFGGPFGSMAGQYRPW